MVLRSFLVLVEQAPVSITKAWRSGSKSQLPYIMGFSKPYPFCRGSQAGLAVPPSLHSDLELHSSVRKERTSIIVHIMVWSRSSMRSS